MLKLHQKKCHNHANLSDVIFYKNMEKSIISQVITSNLEHLNVNCCSDRQFIKQKNHFIVIITSLILKVMSKTIIILSEINLKFELKGR